MSLLLLVFLLVAIAIAIVVHAFATELFPVAVAVSRASSIVSAFAGIPAVAGVPSHVGVLLLSSSLVVDDVSSVCTHIETSDYLINATEKAFSAIGLLDCRLPDIELRKSADNQI